MKPTPEQGRWGILGGTFDPVHNGHLQLATDIGKNKHLDGVLFVPTFKHPLKNHTLHASFADRTEMLERALAKKDKFLMSRIEREEGLSGYTIETVRAIKRRYPQAEFFFIIGADLLRQLERWHLIDQLLEEIPFLVGGRPSYEVPTKEFFRTDRIELVETVVVDISSTEIRSLVAFDSNDDKLESMLPSQVLKYIKDKKLYRDTV
jgi:nicotinate-nucleotide adenylyltransferase